LSSAISPLHRQSIEPARRLSAVLSGAGVVGVAVSAVWFLVAMGPPHSCAMGGLGAILLLFGLVVVGGGCLLSAAALAVALTHPGTARWPWYAVLGTDLLLMLYLSVAFVGPGNVAFAAFLTAVRLFPLASIAVFAGASLRVRPRRRTVVEILICLAVLAWLGPQYVGNGLWGDLVTGFTQPVPVASSHSGCAGA
jgi:hypothetical protein